MKCKDPPENELKMCDRCGRAYSCENCAAIFAGDIRELDPTYVVCFECFDNKSFHTACERLREKNERDKQTEKEAKKKEFAKTLLLLAAAS